MSSQKIGPWVIRALRAPAVLYDWHLGWLLGRRFLRLTHRGRRSGRCYRTMLEAIGNERFRPVYRELARAEAAAVLHRNERRNRLIAPIVRVVLSRLVGWRYDGRAPARERLVTERPILAFRPASPRACDAPARS